MIRHVAPRGGGCGGSQWPEIPPWERGFKATPLGSPRQPPALLLGGTAPDACRLPRTLALRSVLARCVPVGVLRLLPLGRQGGEGERSALVVDRDRRPRREGALEDLEGERILRVSLDGAL